MRHTIVAANWKMHKGPQASKDFFNQFLEQGTAENKKNFIFFIPAANWFVAQEKLNGNFSWGSQNCFKVSEGAFTGENSLEVLKEFGGDYCLVGHSERRQIFAETDELLNEKVLHCTVSGVTPMLCVGETLEEREAGKTNEVIGAQLKSGLRNVSESDSFVVAYEPVWAIGTGKVATPEQAQQAHAFLRTVLQELYSNEKANSTHILYGGSVKPENAKELINNSDIDGFLVGGASLDPSKFSSILKVCEV